MRKTESEQNASCFDHHFNRHPNISTQTNHRPICKSKTNVYRSNPLSMFLDTSTWYGLLLVSADREGSHNNYHIRPSHKFTRSLSTGIRHPYLRTIFENQLFNINYCQYILHIYIYIYIYKENPRCKDDSQIIVSQKNKRIHH